MAAPPLRIPMSLNLDQFQDSVTKAKGVTSNVTKFITKQFIDMNASVLATQGAAGSAVLGFRALLGVMGPLALAAGAIGATFKLMSIATELAKEKIEEFNETAEKAAKSGVSTDFFQRFVKGGESLKLTTDEATAALERFNRVAAAKLGGSELQQRINALSEAGNFGGNSGVGALGAANDNESRLKATVQLIDQALQKGERLAALDIAEKAFGSKVAENLRIDSGYLDRILETAQKISASKIVSDEQIGQAVDLKTRMEAAQKVLEERFKPIQDDLAKLGMNYEESWVGIYERIAQAVDVANQLYDGLKGIPEILARAGNAGFWDKLAEAAGKLGLNSRPDGLVLRGEEGFNRQAGADQLQRALSNPNNIAAAMRQTTDVATAVRGDTSKPTKPDAPTTEEISAYDREIERLNRTIALRQADAAAVGQTREVQEQYRAELALLQALQKDGEGVTNEQIAIYGRLRNELGQTGALQAAGISLNTQHAASFQLISQRALDTGNALRVARDSFQGINDSLRFFGDQTANILDGILNKTTTFQQGMQQLLQNVTRQLLNAALTGEGAFAKILGFASATPGGVGGIFGAIAGLFGRAGGGSVSGNQPYLVGEKGPEVFVPGKSGTVIPNNVVSRGGNGTPSVVIYSNPVYQAGMTPTDIAAIQAMQAQNNQQLRGQIVTDLRRGVASDSRFLG